MELLTPVVSILALFVIVKAIQVLITWSRLIRWRFRQPKSIFTERESLPIEVEAVFQSAEQRLIPLGFRYSHAILQENFVAHVDKQQAIQVFVHEESRTYAEVNPALSPEAGVLFTVAFVTVLTDGHAIVTVDCQLHTIPPCPKWCRFADYYTGNVEHQWEEHQRSLQKTGAVYVLKPCSPQAYMEHNQRFLRELITKNPMLTAAATPREWRMQLLPAVLFSWGLSKGLSKSARVRKAYRKTLSKKEQEPATATAATVSQVDDKSHIVSEVSAFERMHEVQNKAPGWGWLGKCTLLLISVAVAGLSFGLTFSPSFVAILLGTLFFHELGHWFGMWLFDYRDRQMFFIPFLGAAVSGEKEDATPMQQIIVALLGPVPGLILGAACLHWAPPTGESWLNQVGWMTLSLNYLNLLPVNPLDGGRVVDLLLSRFPWLRFTFGIASVVILLLAGRSGTSLMTGIAVAMMFALVTQWRVNIALQRLRKLNASVKNRKERLQAIFQVLTQAPFRQQPANTRYELAKTLLRYLNTGPANWRTMFIGGTVYAAALLLPMYMGVKSSLATAREQVAIMDTRCDPHVKVHKANVESLHAILDENSELPAVRIHHVAALIRTKIPCVAEFKTYDLALLNRDERVFWDLYWFHVKLTLGGFRQYFENDAAKVSILRAHLERIGARRALSLLDRSLEAFPDKQIPETPEAIKTLLQQIDTNAAHPAHALWEELERQYKEQHAEELNEQILTFVREYVADLSTPRTLAQTATQHPELVKWEAAKPAEVKSAKKKRK